MPGSIMTPMNWKDIEIDSQLVRSAVYHGMQDWEGIFKYESNWTPVYCHQNICMDIKKYFIYFMNVRSIIDVIMKIFYYKTRNWNYKWQFKKWKDDGAYHHDDSLGWTNIYNKFYSRHKISWLIHCRVFIKILLYIALNTYCGINDAKYYFRKLSKRISYWTNCNYLNNGSVN